ncbi:MAG: hypothetical protein KFB96_00710 [Thiocapsa sp.]|uniref:hypothetical protein n=1 Tax=Thiocapsa sp. TaxID=2024551 RepID=UPI001BCFB4EA|nr:hypothetical protein [Thiocapsa sp.]QVL49095.1 MAG: hypothetical protein KFB96_00710 [Thiocapsa sp.]
MSRLNRTQPEMHADRDGVGVAVAKEDATEKGRRIRAARSTSACPTLPDVIAR